MTFTVFNEMKIIIMILHTVIKPYIKVLMIIYDLLLSFLRLYNFSKNNLIGLNMLANSKI